MLNLTEVLPSGWRRIEGWVVGSVAERLAQNVGGPVFHLQHYFKKKKKRFRKMFSNTERASRVR